MLCLSHSMHVMQKKNLTSFRQSTELVCSCHNSIVGKSMLRTVLNINSAYLLVMTAVAYMRSKSAVKWPAD